MAALHLRVSQELMYNLVQYCIYSKTNVLLDLEFHS